MSSVRGESGLAVAAARRPFLALLAALALAAVLRLALAPAEFWFDEIWSWEHARAAAAPWQVFLGEGQHHDNNHKLNTLWLWLCPDGAPWWLYRLHSLAAGLAAVPLAARVAGRRGRAEAVFAALLFAADYWLALCSAEARGYALAVCFALVAFDALGRRLAGGGRGPLVLFWAAVILGFCAHLTFLHCYLALVVWSVYHGARRRLGPAAELGQCLRLHAVPGLFFVALYLLDVRRMELGGGPSLPTSEVLGRLLSLGLGGPPSGAAVAVPAVAALVVLALGLRLLARDPSHSWVFFAAAVVGSPALFLVKRPPFLFERYFLISFVFFLLLLSYVLGWLWRRGRAGAFAAAVAALTVVLGGAWQIGELAGGGRGHFLPALAYLERQTPGGVVTLTGDHDFRVRKFHAFYVPYLHSGKAFVYHGRDELPPGGAQWLLVHRLNDTPPEAMTCDARGNEYERVGEFPAAAFGGWSWYVYRNVRLTISPVPAADATAAAAGPHGEP